MNAYVVGETAGCLREPPPYLDRSFAYRTYRVYFGLVCDPSDGARLRPPVLVAVARKLDAQSDDGYVPADPAFIRAHVAKHALAKRLGEFRTVGTIAEIDRLIHSLQAA